MKKSMSFINVVACLLLAFSTFSAYSTDNNEPGETCEMKFIVVKPKKIRRLSPEEIVLLSKETLYSLRPKHLFLTSQVQGERILGGLRLTKDQLRALDLNSLHPETLEAIVRSKNALTFLSDAQAQSLDLRGFSPDTLSTLMSSCSSLSGNSLSAALILRLKFHELDFSEWSQYDLEPFIQDPFLAMHLKKSQIDFYKKSEVFKS